MPSGRTAFVLIILLCLQAPALWAQHTEIEGYIRHGTTDAPIAYATEYNRHLKQGTISNPDGYFSLKVSGPGDSVQVRFVGFRDYELSLSANVDFYTIHIEESALMLDEPSLPKTNPTFTT
ncbi:MAG: carboxypeptidase-like regulatory domain-containing protein [Flavobacteriales bacterium]|nr:carboxypeptidase-like regulatory domain-containing protein [Flavobacteriales bacterium]